MLVLGIETSCDDTSASVVKDGTKILSNVISSQEVHAPYGGVVPELASREHIKNISWVLEKALKTAQVGLEDLSGIAVTNRPGLIVSLLVGLNFAKGLSFASNLPLIGVNHTFAHIYSNHLTEKPPAFPYLCLVLSGGHTILGVVKNYTEIDVVGQTRDDAIGEAFDKVAKFLGLGYPGGPIIDDLSKKGDLNSIPFPVSRFKDNSLDFSYSGLKTAVLNFYRKNPDSSRADIAASFQKTAVKIILNSLVPYLEEHPEIHTLAVTGGVSANSYLRSRLKTFSEKRNLSLYLPEINLCTDNAAMIAGLGTRLLDQKKKDWLDIDAFSRGLD